jgi:hypothetical protein
VKRRWLTKTVEIDKGDDDNDDDGVLVDPKGKPFSDDFQIDDPNDEEYVDIVKGHWNSIKTYFR